MKQFQFFGAILIVLSCLGCKTDPDLTINFFANYDGEPLVMLKNYAYSGDDDINFSVSDFYFSDCYLTNADGDNVKITDLEFIDFSAQNKDDASALIPISRSYSDIPEDEYTTLTFSIGVNETLNATRPEDYTSDNPLSLSGHYWAAWDSYIFSKFQGTLFNDDLQDVDWLFHPGKDEVFRTFSIPIEWMFGADNTVINLHLDHKKLFVIEGDEYYDIREKPTNHDPNDLEPLIFITENIEGATSITFE